MHLSWNVRLCGTALASNDQTTQTKKKESAHRLERGVSVLRDVDVPSQVERVHCLPPIDLEVLESEQHGVRYARHWLDVLRYADADERMTAAGGIPWKPPCGA